MDETSTTTTTDGLSEGGDDILSTLVGEGKKFRTVSDLAKSKVEADSFINKLKEENSALRSMISNQDESKRSTEIMQELLARVSKGTLASETATDTRPATQPGNQPAKAVTSSDVVEIYKVMKQHEQQEANVNKALGTLKDKYKDKTEEVLKARAEEIGLDVNSLLETAKKSPTAFLNLIGENAVTNNNQVNRAAKSSVNSAAVIESGGRNVPNRAYYDKLKQEMGAKKFIMDRGLQIQMHKHMMELGDAWDS